MAEGQGDAHPEEETNFKVPEKKSLQEMMEADKEDDAMKRYKEALLGNVSQVIFFESDPRVVIPKSIALIVSDRPNVLVELTAANANEKKGFVIKEGCEYQIEFQFYVQREIVQGLKYQQGVYRKGIRVDHSTQMLGSYGPKAEPATYTTATEVAPDGMLARGKYTVKSKFVDDDKNVYGEFEWQFEISKEW